MIKAFEIERSVLMQVWQKQKFKVHAKDISSAINLLRRTPKEKVYSKFDNIVETVWDTKVEVGSQFNIEKRKAIPMQGKLDF